MPRLKVSQVGSESTEYEFGNDDVTIGREVDNSVVLEDPNVSRHHAVLQFSEGGWWLRDLGSAHGILHAGGRVLELRLVDRISFEIGRVKFRFMQEVGSDAEGETLQAPVDDANAISSPPKTRKTPSGRGNSSSPKKGKGKGRGKSKKASAHSALPPDEKAESVAAIPLPADKPEAAVKISEVLALERELPSSEEGTSDVSTVQSLPAASTNLLADGQIFQNQEANRVALQLSLLKFRRAKWCAIASAVVGMVIVGWHWTGSKESRDPRAVASQSRLLEVSPQVPPPVSSIQSPTQGSAGTKKSSDNLKPDGGGARQLIALDQSELSEKNQGESRSVESTRKTQASSVPRDESPPAGSSMSALVREPSSATPREAPVFADQSGQKAVLYQRGTDSAGAAPVLSPRLDQVLHLKKRPETKDDDIVDIWLNDQRVAERLKVSTEGDLHFSADGRSWLVQASKPSGERLLISPGQKPVLNGGLQSFQFSRDMAVIATVSRSADQDQLSINGTVKSSYHHLRDLRLSADGKHWACIAAKPVLDDAIGESAGERVITADWQSGIHDQIRELAISEVGTRVAFIGRHRSGWQKLQVGDKLLYEVFPSDRAAITGLTFSPDGKRLAWVVVPERGMPVFHLEGSLPIRAEVSNKGQSGALLSPAVSPAARIVFSQDSRHVAFAASQQSAVVIRDQEVVGYYPALQMDSLAFSPDGTRLAFVSRHPSGEVVQGAAGLQSQQFSAVLNLDGVAIERAPTTVHKMASHLTISVGGISRLRFSIDSRAIAALHTPPSHEGKPIPSIHVNGYNIWKYDEAVQAFEWLDAQKLVVVSSNHPEDYLNRIVLQWIKLPELR